VGHVDLGIIPVQASRFKVRAAINSLPDLAALGLRQNTVSQYLADLRRVGAVAGERRGTHVYDRLVMLGLIEACEAVQSAIAQRLAAQAEEVAALSAVLSGA
jgi:DNA-binding transcriptional ArsR family regulator